MKTLIEHFVNRGTYREPKLEATGIYYLQENCYRDHGKKCDEGCVAFTMFRFGRFGLVNLKCMRYRFVAFIAKIKEKKGDD
jgi:hypothetical protein